MTCIQLLYYHYSMSELQHVVKGDIRSRTLIVFLQGWPDSYTMWEQKMQASQNFEDYKQIYINLPNYGSEKIKWGQDFPILIERIRATIDTVEGVDKKILISHDWGCHYGYVLDQKYPNYFSRIIAMDVPAYAQISGVLSKLMVLFYQTTLIFAFLIGGKIGTFLTRVFALFFKHKPSYFEQIESDRNYPYFYFWKNRILSLVGRSKPLLKGYKPSVPVNYYYALKKPFQFHGKRWEEYLKNNGGTIKAVDSGHWLMSKNREQLSQEIKEYIKAT